MRWHPARLPLQRLAATKLGSALLGVAWLALVSSRLSGGELGLYFGLLSLFELLQHLSSLGITTYVERFLAADWLRCGPQRVRWLLATTLALRLITLAITGAAVVLAWPTLAQELGWADRSASATVFACYLLAEGLWRYCDAALTSMLRQHFSQAMSLLRALLRWCAVAALVPTSLDATTVLAVDAGLAAAIALLGYRTLWLMAARAAPSQPPSPEPTEPPGIRLQFALRGYLALALERCANLDVIKLLLSHGCGPQAVAAFGLTWAWIDLLVRYMPLALLHGHVRALLTLRYERTLSRQRLVGELRRLLRANAVLLAVAAPWMVCFAGPTLLAIGVPQDLSDLPLHLAVLAPLPLLLSARLGLGMLVFAQRDASAPVLASASMLAAPLTVWLLVDRLGPAAALLGCWLLELVPTLVLWRRSGVAAHSLLGDARCWQVLALAAALASALGQLCLSLSAQGVALAGAALLTPLAGAALTLRLRAIGGHEWAALHHCGRTP